MSSKRCPEEFPQVDIASQHHEAAGDLARCRLNDGVVAAFDLVTASGLTENCGLSPILLLFCYFALKTVVCPLFCPILPYFALFCPILPYFALFCPILPYFALFCPILPYFALFCPILPILPYVPYFALFCPTPGCSPSAAAWEATFNSLLTFNPSIPRKSLFLSTIGRRNANLRSAPIRLSAQHGDHADSYRHFRDPRKSGVS
ncbi:hypothetical protein [Sulfuricella sp.]|uniref:hypothetical protein n=1 Tax=Sulfuricella sp. TaxID=2099377 RepID=UPI003BEF22B5